jgi:hypothetical protein
MSSARCAIAVMLVAVLLPAQVKMQAGEPQPIPTRFEFKFHRGSIWIAASEAITTDGSVRPGILRQGARDELASRRALQTELRNRNGIATDDADACDAVFAGLIDGGDTHATAETFAELRDAAASRTVINGRVSGSEVGFHSGMPYTVIGVDTDSRGINERVYLLHPFGRMRFEGLTVCNSDAEYSPPPAAGDSITFLAREPIDHAETLYTASGSYIFYDHDGVLVVPPGFKIDAASAKQLTASAIARMLRDTALPGEKRQQ